MKDTKASAAAPDEQSPWAETWPTTAELVDKPWLDVALTYAAHGVPVFPLSKNKKPVWSNEALGLAKNQGGFKVATTNETRLHYLFSHPATLGCASRR